jgi:lambda repressor-like predicted transcriptional regulator
MKTQKSNHIQHDNNPQRGSKSVDSSVKQSRKKVGCSDDLTARTKARLVHSQHGESIGMMSPVKSSNFYSPIKKEQGYFQPTLETQNQPSKATIRKKGLGMADNQSDSNSLDQSRIRSLLIKGFTIEEIKKLTKLTEKEIKKVAESVKFNNINESSIDLYTELQRDLSKLVLLETTPGQKRDTNAILNAIKLQADLQEKKIQLDSAMHGKSFSPEKVSSDYIHTRDHEILDMEKKGMSLEEISKSFGISISGVNQALDRAKFKLPEELSGINPGFITETRGLSNKLRLQVLKKVKDENLNRNSLRSLVNQLKNKGAK